MDKSIIFREGYRCFSAEEKREITRALKGGSGEVAAFILRMAAARRRATQRADSDARTDNARRVLVGARVPRGVARRYKALCQAKGISLYRFACDALEREYKRLTR